MTPLHPLTTASWRIPQQVSSVGGSPMRNCPVRPDKFLFSNEGPHARAWLAVRGSTARLRSAA